MSASQLLSNIAVYSLQIVILVGVAGFVPAALRMRLPGAKLAYWHLLLAACLLLPIARPWRQETINVGTQALPGVLEVAPAQSAPAPVPAGRDSRGARSRWRRWRRARWFAWHGWRWDCGACGGTAGIRRRSKARHSNGCCGPAHWTCGFRRRFRAR